ncbi:MAG: hypothetical protein II849_02115 [Bacteroidales bacterium]|nr:hypothetical protein [Bacteroidales bacterium]
MKRFAFSKWSAGILPAIVILGLTSCNKVDEIDFRGTVIDTRECTASYVKPDLGYLVALTTPDSLGGDYTTQDGITHHNVVILYAPDRLVYRNDKIRGTFYFDDQYSLANCSIHWNDIDNIPIGVFTSISVD